MGWTTKDLQDQAGKTIFITGANSGIGLEAARTLAGAGARVLLGCRSAEKAEGAASAIQKSHPNAQVEGVLLDLADLSAVRRAADDVRARAPQLDALVNNAGVMALPRRDTTDGFEMQLGTNHLGHFALTAELLPLVETARGRVVNVSSIYHRYGRIHLDDLMGKKGYKEWTAYAQSKLANVLFTLELQRRLTAAEKSAIAVACHPGYSGTNLQYVGPQMSGSRFKSIVMRISNTVVAQSAAAGSMPTVYAAVAEDVEPGGYYGPQGPLELWGSVGKAALAPQTEDESVARKLWEASEELIGRQLEI